MSRRAFRHVVTLVAVVGALFAASRCPAQEAGHKILGTLGLQAGVQPQAGFYLADQLLVYDSKELVDQNGARVPGRFQLTGVGSAMGFAFSYRVPRIATYVSAAVAVPVAWVSGTGGSPPVSINRAGLADVYVQPLRLGWKQPHFDLVTGYAFYVPTGKITPGTSDIEPDDRSSGVSRAQWTHQISSGGTVYFDQRRSWQLSALVSYEINGRKIGIDITRGEIIQLQGGLGKTFGQRVSIGPVGYALWQVRDDRGSEVPPAFVGARDKAVGLGAELDVTLEKGRSGLFFRYEHDVEVETRPLGQIFFGGLTLRAWQPSGADRKAPQAVQLAVP